MRPNRCPQFGGIARRALIFPCMHAPESTLLMSRIHSSRKYSVERDSNGNVRAACSKVRMGRLQSYALAFRGRARQNPAIRAAVEPQ